MQDQFKEVFIVLVAGTTLFIVLLITVAFILLFYKKKSFDYRKAYVDLENNFAQELLKTQLETQEETFHQISEELHDNVGQLLSSTKMLLGITERNLPEVPDTLRTAGETLGKAIQDLRSLSKSLNREWLEQFNLVDNLQAETERINTARTINVQLESAITVLPVKAESQIMLFRIIQEALQNSIKHADATCISIVIVVQQQQIQVTITDDGKGFDTAYIPVNGVGILNMQHRTHLLGGTIRWNTEPEKGTQVFIHVPVAKEDVL